jgi:hypothetical protein
VVGAFASRKLLGQAAKPDVVNAAVISSAQEILPKYVVPESPAFTFLSVTPAKVTRPATAKDLAAAITNAIDGEGRLQQGLAFELPYTRLVGETIRLSDYQNKWVRYALANTQLSASTVRTSGDNASTDAAAGLRVTVIDRSDPLASLSLSKALAAVLTKECVPVHPLETTGKLQFFGTDSADYADTTEALHRAVRVLDSTRALAADSALRATALAKELKCMGDKTDSLRKTFLADHWNDLNIMFAYAQGWRLDESLVSQGHDLGYRLWSTVAIPLGSRVQVIGYGDVSRTARRDSIPEYTAYGYGGRLVVGSPEFNFFAEQRREVRDREAPGLQKHTDPWAGGIEFKIGTDLWLSTGLGKNADKSEGNKNGTVLLANMRWGLSNRPQIVP